MEGTNQTNLWLNGEKKKRRDETDRGNGNEAQETSALGTKQEFLQFDL